MSDQPAPKSPKPPLHQVIVNEIGRIVRTENPLDQQEGVIAVLLCTLEEGNLPGRTPREVVSGLDEIVAAVYPDWKRTSATPNIGGRIMTTVHWLREKYAAQLAVAERVSTDPD
jgi:hypothetical protein